MKGAYRRGAQGAGRRRGGRESRRVKGEKRAERRRKHQGRRKDSGKEEKHIHTGISCGQRCLKVQGISCGDTKGVS